MGTLNDALEWARRGFSVFPLHENKKEPAFPGWIQQATRDEAAIRTLWVDPVVGMERNYNVGCLCTDMVVVDIDVKKGKNGYAEYMAISGDFDTLVVETPSGGWHCYFNGPDSSNCKVSDGVDIRSHNGFTVAPGSKVDGGLYKIVNDVPMVWVPSGVEQRLNAAHVKASAAADFKVDSAASLEAATRYLQSTPPAVEGMNGDDVTFKTAARVVRELGLSTTAAWELMLEHWNPRCVPPWDVEELLAKVENAVAYGTAAEGLLTPEATFGQIKGLVEPPPSMFVSAGLEWGNASSPYDIKPRDWVMDRVLMRRNITLLMAAGSAGKSSLALSLAAHLAVGEEFAGFKAKQNVKTIVYNGEDGISEQSRRLEALCTSHNMDYNEVKKGLMLVSPRQLKISLVTVEGRRPLRNDAVVDMLIEKASPSDVGLLILDPLVKVHGCDESDNVQMDFVMETLSHIAYEANVAILALHHTSKGGSRGSERTGNMDIGRGASAIVNAARVAFTLLPPTEDDAEIYGLTPESRGQWARLDDAKMNLSLARANATWFHKEGVKIMSRDVVGVLTHKSLSKSSVGIQERVATIILTAIAANGGGSMVMKQAVSILKLKEPLWANKTDTAVRQQLEGMFYAGYQTEKGNLRVLRSQNPKDGKESLLLTFT